MKRKKLSVIIGLILLTAAFSSSQQTVVMTIKEGMPAIPLALPSFFIHGSDPDLNQSGTALRDIIKADMKYSRVFSPLPENYYGYIPALDPADIRFKDWESIQAGILLAGEISAGEKGSIVFEVKVYDVKAGRFIFGKKYDADPSRLREAAHKISDEMMIKVGEQPIFSTKIVFVSNRDGNDELYMMDYDGHNQTRLTFNKIKDYMPAWSADGRRIAYTSYRFPDAGLYMLDLDRMKETNIHSGGTNWAPAFSPDGKKLVFCTTLEQGNTEIYIADAGGGKVRQLTFNRAVDTAPSWSPTSREIAFTSDRSGTPQIYIMDAEGANIRRVSFGGSYHDAPAWSPTGDSIVYVSRVDQIFDLYILNLRTQQITKLTESAARNESPTWSPDGRHIIFSSTRTGSIQLYSIDYDGQNLRRLTSRGENKLPNWSRK